ncbi:hypothetical protein [Peribacillus frigoritolerans]|uniref:hypothetical protein n=1 Tax=Peribacillus frigoritolerans TaxID=450367 RepID=UPI0007BFCF54|nr:hypothetical protein [Peribacillus frigoritolerans]
MDKEKGSKETKTKQKGIEVLGDKKEVQTQMLELQRETTETLNKVLNEITLLNSNLEKMGTAISSMQQNVPTTNSSNILANLDADTMLTLLPIVRSLFKDTETEPAMYPMSQVPQPNSLSFLNNLDIDKLLEILPVVRSFFKGTENLDKILPVALSFLKGTETGPAMYSMSQVPQPNPLSFLNNLDIDKVLEILPVVRSCFKGTETGPAMYSMSQVPQPNSLSFLNNLDIDKVLEILPVVRSLYKVVGESEGKIENKE